MVQLQLHMKNSVKRKHLSILQKHKSFKIGLSEFESKYEVKKTSILFQADRKLTIWFILHRTELLFLFFFSRYLGSHWSYTLWVDLVLN